MRRFSMTTILALPAFAGLLLLGAPTAEAQCTDGSTFCAEVNVGSTFNARARVRVRSRNRVVVRHRAPYPPVRRAQVVVVQPAQPAPPPPPPQQAPPVVIVQQQPIAPAPPPATATVVVTTQPQQTQVVQTQQQREPRRRSFGMHLMGSAVISRDVSLAGFRLGPRFRPRSGHFALEVNFGYFAGNDYNGLQRTEYPIGLNTYFFFNPQHRVQFYGVLGLGVSWGHADGFNRHSGDFDQMDFAHFNGEGGLGLEWRIKNWFALNFDVRGLIRQRVGGDDGPEFVEYDDFGSPTGRETNTSGGAVFNGGVAFYF